MADLIESSPSGRAKCRGCSLRISKGERRFGKRFENPYGEGEATHWYHLLCAAEELPDRVEAALSDFPESDAPRPPSPRTESQAGSDELRTSLAHGRENPALHRAYFAERDPSGRARCQQCRERIAKDDLRVVVAPGGEGPSVVRKAFVHAVCISSFAGAAGMLERLLRTSAALTAEDTSQLKAAIPAAGNPEGAAPVPPRMNSAEAAKTAPVQSKAKNPALTQAAANRKSPPTRTGPGPVKAAPGPAGTPKPKQAI